MKNNDCINISSIELSSIASGYQVINNMYNNAEITLIKAELVEPGKFLIISYGDEANINEAHKAGITVSGGHLLDSELIYNIDNQVIETIDAFNTHVDIDSIGLVETTSCTSTLYCANKIKKELDVELLLIKLKAPLNGKGFFMFSGRLSEVEVALETSITYLSKKNCLYSSELIPNPTKELISMILKS